MASMRRILVSMSHAVSDAGVEAALAGVWTQEPAEITGLFVEDLDVINLGRLRVSREVRLADPRPRIPDAGEIERQIRADARRVQAAFEARTRRMNLAASFRVARGRLRACLLEACADVDVLVVAAARDWMGQRLLLRTNLPDLAAGGPPTIVFVNLAPASAGGIAVLAEDTAPGRNALRTAADMARAQHLPLSVLLPAADDRARQALREFSAAAIGDCPQVTYHRIGAEPAAAELAAAARRSAARALILPRDGLQSRQQTAVEILERADCSVLLAG